MTSKPLRLGIIITLAVVLVAGVVWLALPFSRIGITSEIGTGGLPLSANDFSAIPQSVIDDATKLANGLFGEYQEECDDFVNQLLILYSEANNKDFVIFFSPGGWGWSLIENSPGWWSISTGIKSELDSSSYTSLLLNYRRTVNSMQGRLNELAELVKGYSTKSQDLAYRVEFLTAHIPKLKVIVAGESNGTVISDAVMNILKDNPRVYSIQTGPPFWYTNIMLDRTLVITDNGITPDSFSQGDILTIIHANLRSFFSFSRSEDNTGNILKRVRAPGHDYWWQYPGVYSQITNFLEQNFDIK